ncbi:MAG: hypothetical protein OXG05_04945 [Gammaproteobacteria bacterium]|nr:hypothetical protein [Gammaproteobacteria bacterium]
MATAKDADRVRPALTLTKEELEVEVPEPRLNWMNQWREWGVRVRPGKKGLTLGSLNVGLYGEIPMNWPDRSRNPRGAIGVTGTPPVAIQIKDKVDLWAPCAADLYEEAIQRRWAPATDVDWKAIHPLPEDIERAICQVCTEICQYAIIDVEVITSWQHQMAYGYHEVKQFLATTSLDATRRHEAFRKRALVNGGGLGYEGPCQVSRLLLESSSGWTETVTGLILIRALFTQVMIRYLNRFAYNGVERKIYECVTQDFARLITYGVEHIKYALAHAPDKQGSILTTLAIGFRMFNRDLRDPVLREALAIVFGGGIAGARNEGMLVFYEMLDEYVQELLDACQYLRLPVTIEQLPRVFQKDQRHSADS